jgi:hypothetical protein
VALTTAYNALTLNAIHVEAGGSSETQASINDADIRALIGKAEGVQMAFSEWYGASSGVDSQTVTVGLYNSGTTVYYRGFSSGVGSISDGTCNFKSGANIKALHYAEFNVFGNTKTIQFQLEGWHANSGFTTMTIGSTAYARSSIASFNQYDAQGSEPKRTAWIWMTTTNPFGTTSGATVSVVFT